MSNQLFYWYKDMQQRINNVGKINEDVDSDVQKMIEEWKEAIQTIETARPDIKESYERYVTIQKSFTHEQIDFICYQIGDWYCEWEGKMWVDGKPNQHWLGRAKEQLKLMICGE